MTRIVKITTGDGRTIEGEEMNFETVAEQWCSYRLEDGYTLKAKLVATQIVKTAEEDADGNPVYVLRSQNVMAVSPPTTYSRKEVQ